MRLSCPNCDAQYEVPDEVMPASGRDVQCSNCGQTWFQHHPDHPPAEDSADYADEPEEAQAPPPPPPAQPAGARKKLDPAVQNILRAEAEAEQAARRRETGALESQPDLGLEDTDSDAAAAGSARSEEDGAERRAEEARRRMARMRGEPDPGEERPARNASGSSRRALLPDIDEINSTLRNDKDRAGAEPKERKTREKPEPKQKRRGFRGGFVLVLLIAAIGALVYLYAPEIARTAPQTDPYLSGYVSWVDSMRYLLENQLGDFSRWLETLATPVPEAE
jgi:predicted Zn finger-like uncharacterized protein